MKKRILGGWPNFSLREAETVKKITLSNKVNYWTGDHGKKFEEEFSEWVGVNYSIALANGTLALELALKSLNLSPKDEVIVTPRSFIASVTSVIGTGSKPVFADVNLDTGNIESENIKKVITPNTKAIICVHLGGRPCDMDPIMKLARKNKIYVIEDCAQAHGASYKGRNVGSIGDIGAWSFCQDKIMTTLGEGGMVTTNNKKLWKYMWAYKDHGKSYDAVYKKNHPEGFRWLHESFGSNYRMTEIQAAIGRIQLEKMQRWTALRTRNKNILEKVFKKHSRLVRVFETPSDMVNANYKVYAFINDHHLKKSWTRDKIIKAINATGVPCFSGSCSEIYKEKAFKDSPFQPKEDLINTKEIGKTSLMFLCHPSLTSNDMNWCAKNIDSILLEATK